MSGLDCLGVDEEVGFDYLSLAKGAAGMLSGAGGLMSGGGGGGGDAASAEKKRLEEEKAKAEKSAATMKTVLIVLGVLVGVGGLTGAAVALTRRK